MNEKQQQMILDNIGLIYVAIKKLSLQWETEDEWQDYYDNGLVGLIRGVKSFRPDKGMKPSTFLMPCIENEIRHYLKAKKTMKRFNQYGKDASLNKLVGEPEDTELLFCIKDPKVDIEKQVEQKIQIETIINEINDMKNTKDALVLKMYFGLEGFTPRTQYEIGDILNISQSMVGIRLKRGIKTLKEVMKKNI